MSFIRLGVSSVSFWSWISCKSRFGFFILVVVSVIVQAVVVVWDHALRGDILCSVPPYEFILFSLQSFLRSYHLLLLVNE